MLFGRCYNGIKFYIYSLVFSETFYRMQQQILGRSSSPPPARSSSPPASASISIAGGIVPPSPGSGSSGPGSVAFDVSYAESAVAAAFSGAGNAVGGGGAHAAAVSALDDIFRRSGVGVGVARAVKLMQSTARTDALFYALQTMQWALARDRAAEVSDAEAIGVRDAALGFLGSVILGPSGGTSFDATFIKNKLAVVYALLVRRLFPGSWETAFADLLSLLQKSGPDSRGKALDFFFRVLDAIDDEIVLISFVEAMGKNHLDKTTAVKDAMRVAAIPQFAEVWYTTLTSGTFADKNVVQCLKTMQRYASWVSLDLIANERFVQVFLRMISSCATSASGEPAPGHLHGYEASMEACACLEKLVDKGMHSAHKVQLMYGRLGMFDAVPSIVKRTIAATSAGGASEDDAEFVSSLASLVDTAGLMLLECCKELVSGSRSGDENARLNPHVQMPSSVEVAQSLEVAARGLEMYIPLMLECLGHDDVDVQESVLEFLNAYVSMLGKKACAVPVNFASYLPSLLPLICQKMAYPADFQYNAGEDEDEAEFEKHRYQLRRAYVNIVRAAAAEAAFPFLKATVARALAPSAVCDRDLEVALSLVYHFGEAVPAMMKLMGNLRGAKTASQELRTLCAEFAGLVVAVHESMLGRVASSHHAVVSVYNEITARYASVFSAWQKVSGAALVNGVTGAPASPDLVRRVLTNMASGGGLRHENSFVRSRAAYLLLRTVKLLDDAAAAYGDEMLWALQDLLVIPKPVEAKELALFWGNQPFALFAPADVLNLYEIVGFVIGAKWFDKSKRAQHISAVMSALSKRIEELVVTSPVSEFLASPANGASSAVKTSIDEVLSNHFSALAAVTKGLARTADEDVAAVLSSVFASASLAVRHVASSGHGRWDDLRSKYIFLLHRLSSVLQDRILPPFSEVAPLLLSDGGESARGLTEVIQLLNKFLVTYDSKMRELMDALLGPVFDSVTRACAVTCPPGTDEDVISTEAYEQTVLRKWLFLMLQAIINSADTSPLLYSARNIGRLGNILDALVAGMESTDDVAWATPKACVVALGGLLDAWIPANGSQSKAPAEVLTVFRRWVFETMTPATFRCTAHPSFDASDASCAAVLLRICTLHRKLRACCGDEWLGFVQCTYLPSVGCPSNLCEEYVLALRSDANDKQIRAHYTRIFLSR